MDSDALISRIMDFDAASSTEKARPSRLYWPAALRVSWLLFVLISMLGLIAALESAIRVVPTNKRDRYAEVEDLKGKIANFVFATSTDPSITKRSPQITNGPSTSTRPTLMTYTLGDAVLTLNPQEIPHEEPEAFYVPLTRTTSSTAEYGNETFATSHYVPDGPRPSEAGLDAHTTDLKQNKDVTTSWPRWQVFVGNYLGMMLAVLLKMLWTPVVMKTRLMEPFLSMTKAGGARASKVFFNNYLSSTVNPIKLILNANALVIVATFNIAIITLMAPLASEAVFLDTRYDCPDPDRTSKNPCWPPRISIDPYITRALQGLLGAAALIALGTIVAIARSPFPKLKCDPSSIAGVAVLVHHPVLIHDLRTDHPDGSLNTLKASLPNRAYALQDYQSSTGHWRYGMAPLAGADYGLIEEHAINGEKASPAPPEVMGPQSQLNLTERGFVVPISVSVMTCGLLVIIIAYKLDDSNDGFNNFFNGDTFGPRFVMTAAATLVSLGMETLHNGRFIFKTLGNNGYQISANVDIL